MILAVIDHGRIIPIVAPHMFAPAIIVAAAMILAPSATIGLGLGGRNGDSEDCKCEQAAAEAFDGMPPRSNLNVHLKVPRHAAAPPRGSRRSLRILGRAAS